DRAVGPGEVGHRPRSAGLRGRQDGWGRAGRDLGEGARAVRRAVVITGVGAITPLGVGADTLIDRWTAGASGIEDGLGRCAQFDPAQTLTRKQMHRSDRFTQLALAAAAEAIAGAGWADELPYPPERIGCIVGTGIGGVETCMSQQTILDERGADACSPLGIPMMMPNAASGAIAMRYGIAGPNW